MSCQFDEMLLYEYLDDILDTEEKLQVERHLSACPSCRKKLTEIKVLFYELDNISEIEVPKEVDAIRQSILEEAFKDRKITAGERLKQTKKALEETPIVGAVMPNKANLSRAAKGIYNGSKKLINAVPKKEAKPKKQKSTLGGLL